jgi:hypothetical protein
MLLSTDNIRARGIKKNVRCSTIKFSGDIAALKGHGIIHVKIMQMDPEASENVTLPSLGQQRRPSLQRGG